MHVLSHDELKRVDERSFRAVISTWPLPCAACPSPIWNLAPETNTGRKGRLETGQQDKILPHALHFTRLRFKTPTHGVIRDRAQDQALRQLPFECGAGPHVPC